MTVGISPQLSVPDRRPALRASRQPAQNKSRRPLPVAEGRSNFAEDHGRVTALMRFRRSDFPKSEAASELAYVEASRRIHEPARGRQESKDLQWLTGTRTCRSDGRSSPPAEKCGVSIGESARSQDSNGRKVRRRKHMQRSCERRCEAGSSRTRFELLLIGYPAAAGANGLG